MVEELEAGPSANTSGHSEQASMEKVGKCPLLIKIGERFYCKVYGALDSEEAQLCMEGAKCPLRPLYSKLISS